jgi:hypothetical protein
MKKKSPPPMIKRIDGHLVRITPAWRRLWKGIGRSMGVSAEEAFSKILIKELRHARRERERGGDEAVACCNVIRAVRLASRRAMIGLPKR